MIAAGYAWREYSHNCPNTDALITAENIAKKEDLGVQSAGY